MQRVGAFLKRRRTITKCLKNRAEQGKGSREKETGDRRLETVSPVSGLRSSFPFLPFPCSLLLLDSEDCMTNFDKLPARSGSGSVKWDWYKDKDRDILPMWVADMDFESPPAVLDALRQRVDHGVFGYTWQTQELVDVVIARMKSLYDWDVQPEWLVWLSGLVSGLNVTCRAVGDVGDDVLTSIPIYPPFLSAPKNQYRTLSKFAMVKNGERWEIDFDAFEKAVTPKTKMFILCNPHNPLGRIFAKDELLRVAEMCEKHDLIICSDEIDTVFPGSYFEF